MKHLNKSDYFRPFINNLHVRVIDKSYKIVFGELTTCASNHSSSALYF